MSEKKVGKRLLTWVLVLVMTLSLLPLNVLAVDYGQNWKPETEGDYVVGDTISSTDRNTPLPTNIPANTEWNGPERNRILNCGMNEHWHRWPGCYTWDDYTRDWRLSCSQVQHYHDYNCYSYTYTWTLQEKNLSGENWRRWWPLYWSFDQNTASRTDSLVTVTAGTVSVLYTEHAVSAKDALSASTASAGDAVDNNIQITVAEGYYVSKYRIVCGNFENGYNGCGVVGYNDATPVNQGDDYSAAIEVPINGDKVFNHGYDFSWKNYPTQKPDPNSNNLYQKYDSSNIIYPFYLLIELTKDENKYTASYEWGNLSDTLTEYKAPDRHTNLKRNQTFEASAPSQDAIDAAAAAGYEFAGWSVTGKG